MNSSAFAFGKNWDSYVKNFLNEKRIDDSRNSITDFCEGFDFKGKTFIDVGCGSGLFSCAAYRLGAAQVVSLDVDPDSVRCCEYMREKAGSPDNWKVLSGSILDDEFLKKLGKHDFVYSWGVLHHTGDMWKAIENAISLVNDGGMLYIAIYNKAEAIGIFPDGRISPSGFWTFEKKIYSKLPLFIQNLIDYAVMAVSVLFYLVTFNNPVRKIRDMKQYRGMSWRIDIKDWMGGYPYEYASVSEIFTFVKKRGFSLENLKNTTGLKNNEFLFKKN